MQPGARHAASAASRTARRAGRVIDDVLLDASPQIGRRDAADTRAMRPSGCYRRPPRPPPPPRMPPPPPLNPPALPPLLRHDWDWLAWLAPEARMAASRLRSWMVPGPTRDAAPLHCAPSYCCQLPLLVRRYTSPSLPT